MFRDKIKKHKTKMELKLARGEKNSKKGLCRYIGRRKQSKESVSPLINENRDLASSEMEKAEVQSQPV